MLAMERLLGDHSHPRFVRALYFGASSTTSGGRTASVRVQPRDPAATPWRSELFRLSRSGPGGEQRLESQGPRERRRTIQYGLSLHTPHPHGAVSSEALHDWLTQATENAITGDPNSIINQVDAALSANDHPLIELRNGTDGHVVVAYNVEDGNNGDKLIDVYNPNQSSRPMRRARVGSRIKRF